MIELLCEVAIPLMTDSGKRKIGEFSLRKIEASAVADHLIANGMTVPVGEIEFDYNAEDC